MMKYDKYKVLLISSWILLGLCCIIKLVGFNLFIAYTDNEKFIKLCNYIDNRLWLQCLLMGTMNLISCSLYYMAVLKESRLTLDSLKWFLPLIPYIILKQIFYKYAYEIIFIGTDVLMMIFLPILINRKVWFWSIICFILVLLFELISVFLKMNHYKRFDDNTLVYLILSLDYYIMIVLLFLYRNKKQVKGGTHI